MRYIFFTTGAQPWVKLATRLHDEGLATPVLWVGDPKHEAAARQKFGDDVVQSMDVLVHYPWRLQGVDYDAENHDYLSSMEYYRAKDRALKMMDRLDLYGTFSRLDREVYFKNICIWGLKRISALKPDALIVNEAPHSHAQYALFEICRYLKIPTLKLFPWTIVPVLALVSFDGTIHMTPDRASTNEVHQKIRDGITRYVQSVKATDTGKAYEANYMTRQRRASSFLGQFKTYVSRSFVRMWASRLYHRVKFWRRGEYAPIAPSILNLVLSGFNVAARRRSLRQNNAQSSIQPDFSRKYVYFGLHYEPERTTNPDGGEFHDQILALVRLRSMLPEDVAIYVKEHPSQFMSAMRGVRGRSPLVYENIKNIRNVHLVDLATPSMELIRQSLFVSTITGTLALEAAILGKRSLVFGDAWYKGMPNVRQWHEELAFEDIMAMEPQSHERILDHLIADFEKNYAVGCQNNSFEKHFSAYVDSAFRDVESEELYQMFGKLSRLLNGRKHEPAVADSDLA
jgi:hypothetical protein